MFHAKKILGAKYKEKLDYCQIYYSQRFQSILMRVLGLFAEWLIRWFNEKWKHLKFIGGSHSNFGLEIAPRLDN